MATVIPHAYREIGPEAERLPYRVRRRVDRALADMTAADVPTPAGATLPPGTDAARRTPPTPPG